MMSPNSAETLALQALAWLAASEELLPVFMGASGATVDDFRARTAEPEFLCSVLDFITMDDAWVVEFCTAHGHPYEAPMRARQTLPGGGQVHWT